MNDFDSVIGGAVGARADGAPASRPDFGAVLADRQQKLRRRSVSGAIGVLAIGATAMAAFAAGGPTESTADGPDTPVGSDGVFATTTMPSETVWYCEGALDRNVVFPTTTSAPTTTIALPVDSILAPDDTYVPPIEDSGFFRDCVLKEGGSGVPADEGSTVTTYTEQFPTTTQLVQIPPSISGDPAQDFAPTSGAYVVQAGDSPISVAEKFGVALDDLLNFNGWGTASEFPFPGEEIRIPPLGSPTCTVPGCDTAAIHTVQAGDYLIKVADDYCVEMGDVIALNGWESDDDFPFPGERILIPAPSIDSSCSDDD